MTYVQGENLPGGLLKGTVQKQAKVSPASNR